MLIDGRETNKAINKLLAPHPVPNSLLEMAYMDYCNFIGIVPRKNGSFGVKRKFWQLDRPIESSSTYIDMLLKGWLKDFQRERYLRDYM